jgi:hypothetical protein
MPLRRTRDQVARIFYQRCFYLFIALIALLVATPLVVGLPQGRLALAATQAFVLAAAVAAVSRSLPAFVLTALLAGVAVWHLVFAANEREMLIALYAATATYLVTLAALLRYVLRPEVMTADKLYGAAAAYLLLGVCYASAYQIVQHFHPGSFALGGQVTQLSRFDFVYFSFTVMTGTGFGDFTAVLPLARMLVITEQIAGVLYVAILIARLAGIYPPGQR